MFPSKEDRETTHPNEKIPRSNLSLNIGGQVYETANLFCSAFIHPSGKVLEY
jgi:hypothetical protein